MSTFNVSAFVEALTADLMTKVGPDVAGLVVSDDDLREALSAVQAEIESGMGRIVSMAHPGEAEAAALDRALALRAHRVMDLLRGNVLCSAGTRATVGALLDGARRTVASCARSFR